jgi:tRNA G18 (ribose-2'-O)-methylase SpoU
MKPRRIAIAYNIRSAHNVGSLFRTADAAGIDTLYLCGITPAPIDRFGRTQKDVAKTALGAEKYIVWEKIGTSPTSAATLALIKKLRKEKFFIVAVEQSERSISYTRVRTAARSAQKKDIALIVGDEVRGLPPSILNAADCIAEIPMRGKKESLNVAVAFGIAVFAL